MTDKEGKSEQTFAERYKKHAYADLIQEAETQGIGRGVKAERERIAKMLRAECCCDVDWLCSYCKFADELEGLR